MSDVPTNGKVERLHRTLADEWAYARAHASETERRGAFDDWLHHDNHHRFHTAIGGPPASRFTNLTGQHTWSGPHVGRSGGWHPRNLRRP